MTEIEELYKNVITKAQENLEILGQKLIELKDLRSDLIIQGEAILQEARDSKDEATAIPKEFQTKFEEISQVSKEYLEAVGRSTEKYLQVNNTILTNRLLEIKDKTGKLGEEITRLEKIDPTIVFESQSKKTLKIIEDEFNKSIKVLNDENTAFQDRNSELRTEVDKISRVDLQVNFDRHQKTLSDIFGAINAINLTLTGLTGSLNSVIQKLGQIQEYIEDNFKETKKLISTFSKETNNHLSQQGEKTTQNLKY